MISTVLAKPTKDCNADCSYCSSPPEGNGKWSWEQFEKIFTKTVPHMHPGSSWIWHGGEPMLMGPKFFEKAVNLRDRIAPGVRFSIQTNLLSYKSSVWKDLFLHAFDGSLSTSYDVAGGMRTINGDADRYERVFLEKLDEAVSDGLHPMVLGIFGDDILDRAHDFYDMALKRQTEDEWFSIRVNYKYPIGRNKTGDRTDPELYGKILVELFDRWMKDVPNFGVTPLDQMLWKTVHAGEGGRCPWVKGCAGSFLGIEPSGDTYNCADFADMKDSTYSFGNIFTQEVDELLESRAARAHMRRTYKVPSACQRCEHFEICEGGCMRDSANHGRGLYGHFEWCISWKMLFTKIKNEILSGKADDVVKKFTRRTPEEAKMIVENMLTQSFDFDEKVLRELSLTGSASPFGFFNEKGYEKEMNAKDCENILNGIMESSEMPINVKGKYRTIEIKAE